MGAFSHHHRHRHNQIMDVRKHQTQFDIFYLLCIYTLGINIFSVVALRCVRFELMLCAVWWTQCPIHLLTHHLYAMAVERRPKRAQNKNNVVCFSCRRRGLSERSFRISWIESNEYFTRRHHLSSNDLSLSSLGGVCSFSQEYFPSYIGLDFEWDFFWPYAWSAPS